MSTDPDIQWNAPVEEVLTARQGSLGRIRLNRPRPINALTLEMIEVIHQALRNFGQDESISAVALDGAGERGLCSGADVRGIREGILSGTQDPETFFRAEYALDQEIAAFAKPVAAFMDGVVMGGGLGLSAHASLRLVTERTKAAMPETGIGFFPDVGMMYPLSHAPGQVGTHMAMTGVSVTGADAIAVGLADAQIEPAQWPQICSRLAEGENPGSAVGSTPPSPLMQQRDWIDTCYAGDDPAQVEALLSTHTDPHARAAADTLRTRSPLSVAVTLAALRRAARLGSVAEVLDQDLHLARAFMAGSDFLEGVRALLVDKDNSPAWQHSSLAQVDPAQVRALLN